MKHINDTFNVKFSMTSKIVLGAIVAIAFLAGTITTATLAEAKPNTDGDGDGAMEGIIHEIVDLLNHATYGLEATYNAIMSVQSDIDTLKSDVTMLKNQEDDLRCHIVQPYANLSGCDFRDFSFYEWDLEQVNFSGADFSDGDGSGKGASLILSNLHRTNLSGADFTDASLIGSNLQNSDVTGADFTNAELFDANFSGTNLEDALGAPFIDCINHALCE